MIDFSSYTSYFTDAAFWSKLGSSAVDAGREVVLKALMLYYAMIDDNTPVWAKGVIAGALGYFILPVDAIPDFTPVIGYSDDLGVLAAALATVALHVTVTHRRRAEETLGQWF
jgi:uncharacterized membrane protein YkvA (DUF1232 family)